MKRPDRDTIRRVLDERATPQEAREVARWFSSAEGAAELSRLIDEEARMLETGERMPASGIPSEAIYRRIRAALVRRRRRRIALRVAAVLIPCLLFPTIEDIDVSVFSLYETYEMLGRKPVMAQEKLDIEALGARDACLLGLEQGDLVLLLECVSYDASGQAIEYVKSFNRGDTGGYTYTY